MRVVHFGYADLLPGAARASYRLHRGLRELDVDSRMVVMHRRSEDPSVTGPRTRTGRLLVRAVTRASRIADALLLPDRPEVSAPWLGSGLIRRVVALDPDVVQLHWLGGGLVRPEGLAVLRGRVTVWRLPDMWPVTAVDHYGDEPATSGRPRAGTAVERWVWARKRRAYAALDRLTVVCPTEWLADRVRHSALLAGHRVEIVPTGVDTRTFRPVAAARARAALGLPQDGPVVLFGASGGTANPRKGFAYLDAALRVLAAGGTRVELAVFGGGDVPEGPFRVHRLGVIDDEDRLALVYSAADVLVAPSLRENLANTVLEALACGTPVVAFRTGGIPEAVEHLRCGYVADPRDATDLARGIGLFTGLDAPGMRDARAAARQRACTRFDLRRQATRYLALYEDLMAAERRGGEGAVR